MHFPAPRRARSNNLAAAGVCVLFLAAIFAVASLDMPPARAELVTITGSLEQVIPATGGKNSIPTRFRLKGSDVLFQYLSKSGEAGLVESRLKLSGANAVRVLVEPNDAFATVYEIEVDGRLVRSNEEIAAAWRRDNGRGLWVAGICAIVGIGLIARARWRRGFVP